MRKIEKKEALELISLGIFPKCEVSREVFRPVKTVEELNSLERLSSVQRFVLYGYSRSEIASFKIPENALTVSIDEATKLIIGTCPDDYVYFKIIGKEEILFSSKNQLFDFIKLYQKCTYNGDPFLLYWK